MAATRTRLEPAGVELLAEAGGRSHRVDPVLPRSGGPAGNARLTAWTAVRAGLPALVVAVAGVTTALVLPAASSWQHEQFGGVDHDRGAPRP